MNFDQDWDFANSLTKALIDESEVDPRTIVVAPPQSGGEHRLELRIGAVILAHELQEAEVDIAIEELAQFVRDDIRSDEPDARKLYLHIVAVGYGDQKPKRRASLFDMFRKTAREREPVPEWEWLSVEECLLMPEGYIAIRGRCSKASPL